MMMEKFMKLIKSIFDTRSTRYTGSTGPGSGYSCECKCSNHSGKFGPG